MEGWFSVRRGHLQEGDRQQLPPRAQRHAPRGTLVYTGTRSVARYHMNHLTAFLCYYRQRKSRHLTSTKTRRSSYGRMLSMTKTGDVMVSWVRSRMRPIPSDPSKLHQPKACPEKTMAHPLTRRMWASPPQGRTSPAEGTPSIPRHTPQDSGNHQHMVGGAHHEPEVYHRSQGANPKKVHITTPG